MAGLLLSPTEKVFILHGVQDDFRSDGRSNIDYRPLELETDVVSHASGSARLRLANTDILVGVKTEIDVPKPDLPNLGKLEFFVDCSANATPEFEGRGGEQLASSISNMLQKAYHSSQAFNLKQLCILEGKQCWKLYIDILILECGGNLCDAVSLAVKAALYNTRIPFVKAALMDGGNVDLTLSDDPYDSKLLDVGTAPLLVTLCKIGDKCVVDPSAEEESCSVISLVVGITGNPRCYCDRKDADKVPNLEGKCSTIAMNGAGSVAPKTLKDAIHQGIIAAKALDEALGDALIREQEEKVGFKKHSYGFLK
ncbi:exosome complex component RRP42 [Pectinophora gossypiella]|uniref:exosome complex component RRP42 n=1 Tax=Pectinophora gossypiella TaxID=13191 RepID=UPI00214F2D43|nr:exosome complex component RRP42 [Pectinophora gossypiella]XP_049879731.1 exosome complex component RRP42 [Pectinophora gossypiella]